MNFGQRTFKQGILLGFVLGFGLMLGFLLYDTPRVLNVMNALTGSSAAAHQPDTRSVSRPVRRPSQYNSYGGN